MSGSRPSIPSVRRAVAVVAVVLLLASVVAGATVTTPGESRSSAEPLPEGETVETTLPEGTDAAHWYRVNVSAGDAVVAELYARNTTNRTVEVELFDANGTPVTEHRADHPGLNQAGEVADGTRARAIAPNVAEYSGVYYVKVSKGSDPDASRENAVPYNLTVRTHGMDRYDPNENGSTATPIGVGQDVEAVAAIYDQDVYAVDLVEGAEYTITVTHVGSEGDDSNFSKALYVGTDESTITDDASGEPDEANYANHSQPFSSDESFTFTTRADGVHYLVLAQSGADSDILEADDYVLSISRREAGGAGGATPTATPSPTSTATDGPVNPTVTPGASPNTFTTDRPRTQDGGRSATPAPTRSPTDVSITVTKTIYPSKSPTEAQQHAAGATPPASGGGLGVAALAAIGLVVLAVVTGIGALAYTAYQDDPNRL